MAVPAPQLEVAEGFSGEKGMQGPRLGPPVSSEIRGGGKGCLGFWKAGSPQGAHITRGLGREASGPGGHHSQESLSFGPFLLPGLHRLPAPAPGILYS